MEKDNFKNACRVSLDYLINRYLLCNTEGRLSGIEKAEVHRELCYFYIAVKYGLDCSEQAAKYFEDFDLLHETTQELTGFMDTKIGFPIKGLPDYKKLTPLFFEEFHRIAVETLKLTS